MTHRISVSVAAIAIGFASLASAESIDIDAVQACFDEPDRLDRLYCYDEALGRTDLSDRTKDVPSAVPILPEELASFDQILGSPDQTETGVPIMVRDAVTQSYVFQADTSTVDMLRAWATQENFKELVDQNDVFIAVASDSLLGSTGGLIVSCESNITHVRFVWDRPVQDQFVDVRILVGSSVSETASAFEQTLRASSGRHYLNAPRGLSGIELLRQMDRAPIAQVTITEGDERRSLFFDMEPLAPALGYIGQHCGWANAPTGETN